MTTEIVRARTYRPDIDALRCVAVIGVILFHLDAEYLPGGFTGVDIFFVISGYLITGLVYAELQASSFTILEFYRRRIKRIIPPMLLMVLATIIAGQFILLPDDLAELAEVSIYSLFSLVNIYYAYFFDSSYFSVGVEHQPLLHLWSLGIEEQFYLVWPAVLYLFYRLSRKRLAISILATTVVASFLYGEKLLESHLEWSYYLLPSRAGELLAGASLVFIARQPSVSKVMSHKVASGTALVAGGFLIAYSYLFISENDGFPGFSAVAPVLGASFIVISGLRTLTILHKPLVIRPILYLGLLSYPLYLWHWPILAYLRYMYGELSVAHELICVLLTLLFSIFSYHVLEAYCRKSKQSFLRVFSVQFIFPGLIVLALAGIVMSTSGIGFYKFGSYEQQYNAFDDSLKPAGRQSFMCKSLKSHGRYFRRDNCAVNTAGSSKVILWGDSHAQHYVGVLGELAKANDFSFAIATHQACLPILHDAIVFSGKKQRASCQQSISDVLGDLQDVDVVVLAGAWSTHFANHGIELVYGLENTIKHLISINKKVVLLGELPRIKQYDRLCNLKALKLDGISCDERMYGSREASNRVNGPLKNLVNNFSDVVYFEPHDWLCDGNVCSAYLDNNLLYYDSGHLSFNGSVALGKRIATNATKPAFVTELSSFEKNALGFSPWDELLKDKVKRAKYSLLESVFAWRGKSKGGAESVAVFDRSENGLEYGYVNLDLDHGNAKAGSCQDRILHLQYSFASEQANNIVLLNLRVSNGDSGERSGYVLWIDHDNKIFLPQGLANDNNSYAGFERNYVDAYFQLPKLSSAESAQLLLYPAAGSEMMMMDKGNTGVLDDVTLKLYCNV